MYHVYARTHATCHMSSYPEPALTFTFSLWGWSADWGDLLARLDMELRLAQSWGHYVTALQQEAWGRAGLIQVTRGGIGVGG